MLFPPVYSPVVFQRRHVGWKKQGPRKPTEPEACHQSVTSSVGFRLTITFFSLFYLLLALRLEQFFFLTFQPQPE